MLHTCATHVDTQAHTQTHDKYINKQIVKALTQFLLSAEESIMIPASSLRTLLLPHSEEQKKNSPGWAGASAIDYDS